MASQTRVYLVEDSPVLVGLFTELINGTGALVVGHADEAPTAAEEIPALHPDVVTIDISLKRGTGFDVLKQLGTNYTGEPPLRIVLTNYTIDQYRDAAQKLGAQYFLDKARDISRLLALISECLGKQASSKLYAVASETAPKQGQQ